MTGILGVNRDIIGFGKGAKPVANMYGFCLADPDREYNLFRDKGCVMPILSPKEIMEGVIEGVKIGGNCSGIPTPQGFLYFHERFIAKPLVFVGTIGLISNSINGKDSCAKAPKDGDLVVIIGGNTGKDGIHGATFSSEALNSNSPASAVQIGDPITQKMLSDAIIKEARDLGLYNAITDNGAGGLSSSVGEMGKNGFTVQLEKVPLKYQGMQPWEIWVSESQERMTLAVSPEKYDQLCEVMKRHGVDIACVGSFNETGWARITYNGEVVLEIDTDFLHNGSPVEHLRTTSLDILNDNFYTNKINLSEEHLKKCLSIARQYDHEVQGTSVLKPLQGVGKVFADSTVIRPVLSIKQGVAMSYGLGLLLDDKQDPYYMAANAIDAAIRNLVVVGANPEKIALLDNFCWSDSRNSKRLWQLRRAAEACYDYAIAFATPFISGKDSMFNDFKGYDEKGNFVHLTDPPTLLITSIGVVDNVEKCVSLDTKFTGDLVYLLGDNSCYVVDAVQFLDLYKRIHQAIKDDLIASAISVNLGGLKYAITRIAKAGMLEMKIFKKYYKESREEFPGRVLTTINPENKEKFETMFSEAVLIGEVFDNTI